MDNVQRVIVSMAVGVVTSAPASAGSGCEPEWIPSVGGAAGLNDVVYSIVTFDDGDGEAVYAAGKFTAANGQRTNPVAMWAGSSWAGLGESGLWRIVYDLIVFDDGAGPALYASGETSDGGGVMRWSGTEWVEVGGSALLGAAAMAVFDDGNGDALYAYGATSEDVGIVVWNGVDWELVGAGLDSWVADLCAFDDGSGPRLFAGGDFTQIDGVHARRLAAWDGQAWASVGGGTDHEVRTLAADPQAGVLYVGGRFSHAGSVEASGFAGWDGEAWSGLGTASFGYVFAIAIDGSDVIAGGWSVAPGPGRHIARLSNGNWHALGEGVDSAVYALCVYPSDSGARILAGGAFSAAGSTTASRIARWDDGAWSSMGAGGLSDAVETLAVCDLGDGPALFGAAKFASSAGREVARWTGHQWVTMGASFNGEIRTLAAFDDGSGPAVYAGGDFSSVGDRVVNHVARWDGSSWTSVGANSYWASIESFVVWDDGNGDALYAAGIVGIGFSRQVRVARWNGLSWSTVGTGIADDVYDHADDLLVADSPGGPTLYAIGDWGAPVAAKRLIGGSWRPVSGNVGIFGLTSACNYDDGTGARLYAGGTELYRLEDDAWSEVSLPGFGFIDDLVVFDDGGGPALYIARSGAPGLYRMRDDVFTPLGLDAGVSSLAVGDTGSGTELYIGGDFGAAPSGDAFFAIQGGCSEFVCPADSNRDGTVDLGDVLQIVSDWGPCPGCRSDIDGDGTVTFEDLLGALADWGPCPDS